MAILSASMLAWRTFLPCMNIYWERYEPNRQGRDRPAVTYVLVEIRARSANHPREAAHKLLPLSQQLLEFQLPVPAPTGFGNGSLLQPAIQNPLQ